MFSKDKKQTAKVDNANLAPDTKSSYYLSFLKLWAKIETVKNGEDAVKSAGEIYLPKLSGQDQKEYEAYVKRASFYNATARTSLALTGAIIRKEPQVKCPKVIDDLLDKITLASESIQEVIRIVAQNIIDYGYYGILVDAPALTEAQAAQGVPTLPYFALYSAGKIINFKTQQIGNQDKLTMLCLEETVTLPDSTNEFGTIEEDRVRVLKIEPDTGFLVVRVFKKQIVSDGTQQKVTWLKIGEDLYPKIKGKNWTEISFVFFGAVSNVPVPTLPILMDLVNLNLTHWQVSADYFHGLHFCAMPTPWAAGFGSGDELYIGAGKAWVSDDPQASCGYLEFTGQGLGSIEKALDRLERQMAVMGARILEEAKKAAEASETVVMRYSGDTATLSSVVTSLEQGLMKCLDFAAKWQSADENSEVKINREFVSQKLSPQDITALLGALQANKISLDTFLYNLQVGEVLPADRTIEDEKLKIQEEENKSFDNFGGGATSATADSTQATMTVIPVKKNMPMNMNKGK
jgi:hypothetical protein